MKTKAKSGRTRAVVLRKARRASTLKQFLPPVSRINFESPTNWRTYREETKLEKEEEVQQNP